MGKKSKAPETEREDWVDEAQRRHKEQVRSRSSGERYTPDEGDNSIRILPRLNDAGEFKGQPFFEYHAHGEVGTERKFMTCGKNMKGKGYCYLCDDVLPGLRDSDSKADRDAAEEMAPKLQFIVQVAYLDDNEEWAGPAVWSVSTGGRGALATRVLGKISGRPKCVDLKKGYNMRIYRTGKRKDTRYESPEFDDAPSRVPKGIVEKIRKFSDLVRPYDEDYMRESYLGDKGGKSGKTKKDKGKQVKAGKRSKPEKSGKGGKSGKKSDSAKGEKGGKAAKKPKGGKGGKSYTSKEFRDLYGDE